jgi:tRNA(Ile)-lysidine synthase
LVRPLLPFDRVDLRQWLDSRYSSGTRPAIWDDPANADLRHDRSWLRQRVLPLLREHLGSALGQRLLSGQSQARADRDAWSQVLRALPELEFRRNHDVVEVAWAPLTAYDKALSEALLRAAAREAGVVLGPARAARLLAFLGHANSGASFDLGQGWVAERAFDRLRILPPGPTGEPDHDHEAWGTGQSGVTCWDGWEFRWQAEPARPLARTGFTTWVSAAPGEIRAARAGDRIRPLGGVGRRAVRRILMEARVPRSERGRYPVLVRGQEIVWIPGVMRATLDLPAPGVSALRIDARLR